MRAPGGREEELVGLRLHQGAQLDREGHEVLVREQALPEVAAVVVAVEAPEVDELVQLAGVGGEVADQVLGEASGLERGPAEGGVELDDFRHFADGDGVGSFFVDGGHGGFEVAGSGAAVVDLGV